MPTLRPEVRDFVASCERIQGLLAQKVSLTPDESELLEMCAIELLSKLRSSGHAEGG